MDGGTLRVAAITAGTLLVLALIWAMWVVLQPPRPTSGGGHYCPTDPFRIGYCTETPAPSN